MIRRFAHRALPLLGLVLAAGFAQAAEYRPVAAESSLGFSGTAEGEVFEGRFRQFEARIAFDPAALDASSFDVTIALASADTASEERDDALQSSDFFATSKFPRAHYRASAFRNLGDGRYAADGTLELKGASKPVTLEFAWTAGAQPVLEGDAVLDRLDFGVGTGDWEDTDTVAREVKVHTRLVLQPAQ